MMNVEDSKPWIVKHKNGVEIFICPYCGYKGNAPYEQCIICKKLVLAPQDPKPVVKKEWW